MEPAAYWFRRQWPATRAHRTSSDVAARQLSICLPMSALALGLAQGLGFLVGPVGDAAWQFLPPEDQCMFDQARQNFYAAARQGLAAPVMWLGKRSSLRELLIERWFTAGPRGLESMEVNQRLIDAAMTVLEERTLSGRTAAVWQLEAFDRHRGNLCWYVGRILDMSSNWETGAQLVIGAAASTVSPSVFSSVKSLEANLYELDSWPPALADVPAVLIEKGAAWANAYSLARLAPEPIFVSVFAARQ